MKATKRLLGLIIESVLWFVAIWVAFVSVADILSDWQTTDRTFAGNFNEAVALFPLNTLYLYALVGVSIFVAFTIGIVIIASVIYLARRRKVLQSRNFSSLKILFVAYVVIACIDFTRYGLAWSSQSFTEQQNSFETIEFNDTRYIYIDQIDNGHEMSISNLSGTDKEVLATFTGSDFGVPLYPSPDGKYFLTASHVDEFNAELLQIRDIEGDIVEELKWTGGHFLDYSNKPNFDGLSALWSPKGDVLAIKGKEYDGSDRAVGAITLINTTDFTQKIVPDFTAELMDMGSDEQGEFLIYNDPKSVWDYYRINLTIKDEELQVSKPQKVPLGICFSAYKDMTVLKNNVYCQTSTALYNELKYERNPDFPNNDELMIYQKLDQAEPTDFSVLSPIISNANYWVVTDDNKYLISYLGAARYGDEVFNEDEPSYPTIVYEIESGKQQKIEDPNSLLYPTKALPHRFIVYHQEN